MKPVDGMTPRRSPRLLLRAPLPRDLAFVTELFARPELVSHRPVPVPDTPEASAARLAKDIAHWARHGYGRWAVEHEGLLIGFGGVTLRPEAGDLNLSYHLHPDQWGRGFASEIVAESLAAAFGPLGFRRVVGLVRAANPASRRVLEKAGFVFEREIVLHDAPTQMLVRHAPERESPAQKA